MVGLEQLDGVSMADYLQYAAVCLDHLLLEGYEVVQMTGYGDFLHETECAHFREVLKGEVRLHPHG